MIFFMLSKVGCVQANQRGLVLLTSRKTAKQATVAQLQQTWLVRNPSRSMGESYHNHYKTHICGICGYISLVLSQGYATFPFENSYICFSSWAMLDYQRVWWMESSAEDWELFYMENKLFLGLATFETWLFAPTKTPSEEIPKLWCFQSQDGVFCA